MTSVWKRHGSFEVPLRDFSVDFRVLVQDIESAYKLGPHRNVVRVDVRPYGDFVEWARSQEPDWDRYAWDGTKVLVAQRRLPKSAMDHYENPDLERAGVTVDEWLRLGFEHYIDSMARSIADGKNVPPLVAVEGEPIDGRHRALAALRLGLSVAPIINLGDADGARHLGGTMQRDQLTSIRETFLDPRHPMRTQLAAAAQRVYDDWQVDEEGYDWQVGVGGICHLIADAMTDVLSTYGVWAVSQSCSVGEVHVNVIAQFREGVFVVDINPYNYETGGGYTWKKRPDITFTPDFVTAERIDSDPFNLQAYVEGYEDEGFGRASKPASARLIEERLGRCLGNAIRTCMVPQHFKGCPEIAFVAARAVERLGHEAIIVVGRGRTSTGEIVGHVWVEIPMLDLGIETNPSQMRGEPRVAAVLDIEDFEAYETIGYYPEVLAQIGPGAERLLLTEAAERLYDKLADRVARCVRR